MAVRWSVWLKDESFEYYLLMVYFEWIRSIQVINMIAQVLIRNTKDTKYNFQYGVKVIDDST